MTEQANRHENLWLEVVNSALLGTERKPPTLPPGDTPLDSTLSRLNGSDSERALLGAAATLSIYSRAGQVPRADNEPAAEPCPPEAFTICSPRSAEHIRFMLSGSHKELYEVLDEWARAAWKARRRAPDECLPALLECAKAYPYMMRSAFLSV